MSEISQLKEEISELREETRTGFKEFRDWRTSLEMVMKGDSDHDIWGVVQKVKDHRQKIAKNILEIDRIERESKERDNTITMRLSRLIGMVIGASAVTGTLSAFIFQLLTA